MEILDKREDYDLYLSVIKICEIFSRIKHDPKPKLLHGDMNVNKYGVHNNFCIFF